MKDKTFFRHGDLLLRPITERITPKKIQKQEAIVLAEGEVTGHRHVLTGEVATIADPIRQLIAVFAPSQLTHQEHKTLTVEPGVYEVIREREYNPFEKRMQRVTD